MRWKALLWTVAVLMSWTGALSSPKKKETNANLDLFILSDTQVDGSTDVGSGSGSATDQENSASGMGPDDEDATRDESGEGPVPTVEVSTASRQLTPCQQLRRTSPNFKNTFVAKCTENGEFQRMQCRGKDRCWCADKRGKHITGTTKIGDMDNVLEQPDCMGGSNLSPCITLLVQYKWDGYQTREPNCSADGSFLPMQCKDNECWCADSLGEVIDGTGKILPEHPNCGSGVERVTGVTKGLATQKLPTHDSDISLVEFTNKPDGGLYVVPGNGQGTIEMDPDNLDNNHHSDRRWQERLERERNRSPSLIEQPGMLAGIVGGAVVGLLCAVLLIMFVVYRIRKKDEGSYALDEPTKARGAYAYQKAPDKEFYA